MKKILFLILTISKISWAQVNDSLQTKQLEEIVVKSRRLSDVERLPSIQGTHIWSGKKSEVIHVGAINASVAEKTARQIFAKVPGVFVYDMDGTGNQMNISTRGLDPHRGWEFNIRKNSVITNSDMYGYPASHYSMPMEAIDRIELVRGTGALQYGAQFGGMLNYVAKQPDTLRAFTFENINSAGSFGLISTYASISGKLGKFRYLAYYSKRVSDGYRDNSESDFDAQSVVLVYEPGARIKLTAELSRSNYVYHIPGALTDSMFHADPRQSTRSRNYFNPEIWVPSFRIDWQLSKHSKVEWTTSAVLGFRNSVMFDRPANFDDNIDPATQEYANRQVDIDNFNSYTSELRWLHSYPLLGLESALAVGVQYFNNDLHRRQLGKGTTETDFDLSLAEEGWGRDMHFKTNNIAFFAENKFQLLPSLSITPGVRIEIGESVMSGNINYYDQNEVPNVIKHSFPLLGTNAEYQFRKMGQLYAGWSQAYRPVIFKDIVPAAVYEKVDKALNDASGFNLEAGFRGSTHSWRWDVGIFRVQYNDRLGTQALYDNTGTFYLFRTNIGNSTTDGAEVFVEHSFKAAKNMRFILFTSTALFNGRYTSAQIRSGDENVNIAGNKIESVPDIITRNGITLQWPVASVSFLYSYTGKTFADALNTKTPSANGAVGIVPAYGLLDINSSFRLLQRLSIRININNVLNKTYFTKRPAFYPGPGIWPSDGRSINVSAGIKI